MSKVINSDGSIIAQSNRIFNTEYVNLVISVVRCAARDFRRGDLEAASFLLSEYCEYLLELSGIDRDYWRAVRARIFAEAGL